MTTTPDAPKARLSLKDNVQKNVIEATEAHFRKWLADVDMFDVRHQHIAKTALSTYIERRTQAQEGVYFSNPETANIVIVKRDPETKEITATKAIKVPVPQWMTDYILSFPRAAWTNL